MIRVLIVNEMRLLCDVIASALEDETDLEVTGYATSVRDAEAMASTCDVLLVSIRLPDKGALRLTEAIAETHPNKKTLILGLAEEEAQVLRYVEAGADGYILKNDTAADMANHIRAVVNDRSPVSPEIAKAMMERLAELSSTVSVIESTLNETADLTPRESEILELIGQGMTNREIADHLVIELGTVKNHVHNILQKLDVNSRGEAAKYLAIVKR